jgi:hypothetical protein
LSVRHQAAHFGRGLVFAESFIDDLAQQVLVGPALASHHRPTAEV